LGGSSAAVGVIAGVVLLAAFSPLLLRFGVAVAVHFQLALFVGIMAVLAYLSGGLGSPPLYAYVLIPTLGVALVGRTPAAAWSLIASLVIVGFLALELSGRSPATEVTQAALLRGHAILGVLGIAVALAFTLVLETQRRRFVADLERARVEAEAASRAKSAFLANVSHELRTPMNGVLGMSALLQNADIDPDHGEMLDVIQKSAGSLLALLDDILDYAQIEAGHLRINAEPFDVRKLLRETVELLNPVAQCKGLELRYDIEPHVPGRLVGDASRIGQILLNLPSSSRHRDSCSSVPMRDSKRRRRSWFSGSRIPDPACPRATSTGSSSVSNAWRRPVARSHPGAAWGWRSVEGCWSSSAVRSRSRADREKAPASRCGFRWSWLQQR
jgi:signal transduction histidine kinase